MLLYLINTQISLTIRNKSLGIHITSVESSDVLLSTFK